MTQIVGLDVETSKKPDHLPWKENYYLTCVSISRPDNTAKTWFFHHNRILDSDYSRNLVELQRELNKYDVVAAHNIKFDINCLLPHVNPAKYKLHCTMVAEYLLNYHSNKGLSLDVVAQKYGMPPKIDKVKKMWDSGLNTAEIPPSILKEYCEDDAYKARKIAEKQEYKIKQSGLAKCFKLQMEWCGLLAFMENVGMNWDMGHAMKLVMKYEKYKQVLSKVIMRKIEPYLNGNDINLSSNDDLSVALYGGAFKRRVKCPVIKSKNIRTKVPYIFTYKNGTKKIKTKWVDHKDTKIIRRVFKDKLFPAPGLGMIPLQPEKKYRTARYTDDQPLYKVDKDTIEQLQAQTLLQKQVKALLIKKSIIDKVLTTFRNDEKQTGLMYKVSSLDNKLHTNYNQTVTATGRLSSSDPNSQNLPRGNTSPIKECIVPRYDGIMQADLSAIELRAPAQLSLDPVMVTGFQKGEDPHDHTRKETMKLTKTKEHRVWAKIFNFRMIYGGTKWGYFHDPKMPSWSLKKWGKVIDTYYAKHPGLKKWQDDNIQHVIDGDGTLTIPTGRIYKFKLGKDGKYNEREIKNYPVQGIAGADILPLAAVIIWKAMRKRSMVSIPILTVHDSIVFDYVKKEEDELADLCLDVFKNLPKYIKQYWGIDWIVPLTGEIEIGANYGSLKLFKKS